MKDENFNHGYAPCASVTNSASYHVTGNQGKDASILYDLVDLMKIFKVTKRTLFNWRARGIIKLVDFGGKLYMTDKMLNAAIVERGGVL